MARRTALHSTHLASGARLVEFAGWELPLHYADGIRGEHLAVRSAAGIFDVSHMGRLVLRGPGAAAFLDAAVTSCVRALEPGRAQYCLLPTPSGGAIDDAFLYNLNGEEYLLVVNAANRERDLAYFREAASRCDAASVEILDRSEDLAMVSLQGPEARGLAASTLGAPQIESMSRNDIRLLADSPFLAVSATGYTGEPRGIEIFAEAEAVAAIWKDLVLQGAASCGLGARDSLRLEAGLPLYGHELGRDREGEEIPAFALAPARGAICLDATAADFPGRRQMAEQRTAWQRVNTGSSATAPLPRLIRCVALTGRGVARERTPLLSEHTGISVGYMTSGSLVPHDQGTRCVGLALLDAAVGVGTTLMAEVRGRHLPARVVDRHLDTTREGRTRPVFCA